MAFELPALPNFSAAVPQTQSPLDQYGKMLQLKALMGQQQMLPLQVQAEQERVKGQQLQNQTSQIELNAKKAYNAYWSNPDKFQSDSSDFPHNDTFATMLGVSSDDPLMGILRGQIKAGVPADHAFADAKNTLQIRQEASKATQEQQSVLKNSFEQLREIAAPILAEKDATKKQTLIDAAAPGLARWAKFDPSLAQIIPQLHAGNFDAFANRIGAEEKAMGFTKATADAQKAQSEAAKAQQEQDYRGVLSDLLAGKKVTPDRLAAARAYEAAETKSTTQSDTLGVTSVNTAKPGGLAAAGARSGSARVNAGAAGSGAGAGAGGGAASGAAGVKDALVDAIGQYKYNPQLFGRLLVKHPDLLALVAQKYPDFDQTSYVAKNKIVQSYTSGPESKSINAINTAMGHAGELGDAIDALNNTQYGDKFLRGLAEKLGVEVGKDKVTTFNTIVHRLSPEITAAYVQGGGGEREREASAKDFDPALGDKQLRSNLGETIKLLRSKIEAQEQQWNTTYKPSRPEDAFGTRFLTPRAKQTLDKWGGQGGSAAGGSGVLSVKAPNGKTYNFKDQQSLDNFKKAAGIQ
ncbi:MAG: hypothetical protein JWO19_4429 [Bryobacterales bacterium]|nr:hypothetical protein [Bryobacterales bacterium]